MQLAYPNKKTTEEILALVEKYYLPMGSDDLPTLFFGDNFKVLANQSQYLDA